MVRRQMAYIRPVSMCLILVSYLWKFKLTSSRQMETDLCLCSLRARALLSVLLHMISLLVHQPPRLSISFFPILFMLSSFMSSVNISHLLLFSVPRSLMELLSKQVLRSIRQTIDFLPPDNFPFSRTCCELPFRQFPVDLIVIIPILSFCT